jgi:hypothetical protein
MEPWIVVLRSIVIPLSVQETLTKSIAIRICLKGGLETRETMDVYILTERTRGVVKNSEILTGGGRSRIWDETKGQNNSVSVYNIRSRKPKLTAVGIRCAGHATPSIR